MSKIRLTDAKLCIDCEIIHDEILCPDCGSMQWNWIANWIKPLDWISIGGSTIDEKVIGE